MSEILRGTNLTKSFDTPFGRQAILSGINLKVDEGGIIALIGESGGGKTTLCRILIGLETTDLGSVFFMGKEVGRLRKRSFEACASIQYVFQDPYASMADEATVISTLSEPARLCKRNHRDYLEPKEALVLAGLSVEEFMNRKIKSLSGGQRQKIAIARALITRPQIIIADESTSMLDESSAKEMSSIFRRLNKLLGISFIIVTYNKNTLFDLCTFIYVLHQGKIVEAGPREEVLTSPKEEYTRQYLECMLNIEGRTDFEQDSVRKSHD
ncbi:dipeptide/oligopeptide/nickel ABC transporter ATP-binding protein [Desulfosporosinus burensis]